MATSDRSTFIPTVTFKIQHQRVPYLDLLGASYLSNINKFVYSREMFISGEFEGAPEMLSYQLYSTVDYWWILCLVNEIIDPIDDFVTGKRIVIPTLQSIEDFLNACSNSGTGNNYVGTVVEV